MRAIAMALAFVGAGLCAGPAGAAARLEPVLRLDVEGRWDENLLDGGGDVSSLIRPGIGGRLEAPTAEAELVYLPDGLLFGGGGAQRGGINHRLVGLQEIRLDRRTALALEQRFERAFDPTALTRPGVLRTTGEASFADLRADFSRRLDRTWTFGVQMREEIVRVDEVAAVNGAVHAPQAWLSRALGPRDALTLWYRYQLFDGVGADASSHEPRLGWSHRLTRSLGLELEGGPARYLGDGETGWLPVGRAAIVYRRPELVLSLEYRRSLFGATGFPGAVWGDSGAAVAILRPWRRWEAVLVAGAFQNGAAPDRSAFVVGWSGAAAVSYDLAQGVQVRAGWRRIEQDQLGDGNLPALGISRNIVGIGLSWELGRETRER